MQAYLENNSTVFLRSCSLRYELLTKKVTILHYPHMVVESKTLQPYLKFVTFHVNN